MYKVVVDRSHALVNVTASGFFGDEDLAGAARALHVAIASLKQAAGHHVTLYDMLDLQVAPAHVLGRFAEYFSDPIYRPIWARRVAFLTRSALITGQMGRVAHGRDDMAVFADRPAAIAWLLAAQDRGIAA